MRGHNVFSLRNKKFFFYYPQYPHLTGALIDIKNLAMVTTHSISPGQTSHEAL